MESRQPLAITLSFHPDDAESPHRTGESVPPFWTAHSAAPERADLLRIGRRLYAVTARVWEHDGTQPVLVLYLGMGKLSDSVTLH